MKNIDVKDILDEQKSGGLIYKLNDELYKFMTDSDVIADYKKIQKSNNKKGKTTADNWANKSNSHTDSNSYVVTYCLSKFAESHKDVINNCDDFFGNSTKWNTYMSYRGYVVSPLSDDSDIAISSIRNMINNISSESKTYYDEEYERGNIAKPKLRNENRTLEEAVKNCITMYLAMNEVKGHKYVIGKQVESKDNKSGFDGKYTPENFITKFLTDWKDSYGDWDEDKWRKHFKLSTKFDSPKDLFNEGLKLVKIITWANKAKKEEAQKYIDDKKLFKGEQKDNFVKYLKGYGLSIYDTVAILTNKIKKLEKETDEKKKNANKSEINKLTEKLRMANKVLKFATDEFNKLVSEDKSNMFSDLIQRVRRVNNFAMTGKFYFSDNDDDDIVDEVDTYVDENDSEVYCDECGCEVQSGWKHCPECGNSLQ